MGRSHRLVGAGVLVISLVAVGCASKARSGARAPVSPVASHPLTRGGGAAPGARPDDGSATAREAAPDTLAQHADAYARNVEALLKERAEARAREPARSLATAAPTKAETGNTKSVKAEPAPADSEKVAAAPAAAGHEEPQGANAPLALAAPATLVTRPKLTTGPSAPSQAVPTERADEAGATDHAGTARLPLSGGAGGVAVDGLVGRLSARVREYPRDAAAHLEFQLLQFLRDEPVPDLGAIASLPAEDRELLTTLLDGLSNFRNALRADANMLQSKKVAPLLELSDRLRAQGDLSIPVAALCSDVKLFGVYEPMEPARFAANSRDNKAILYFEVANFSSQLNGEKKYETRLKQEAVLYQEAGQSVWRDKVDTVVDVSRNRRHDFFIADLVRLPDALPVGRYLLKVTVTDLHANRVAEATVPVEVVAR